MSVKKFKQYDIVDLVSKKKSESSDDEEDIFNKYSTSDEEELLEEDFKRENKNEEKYESKFDYLIIGIGAVVGLGNIWRFPFICYRNGGGVFLIPYLLMVVLFAMPFILIESSLGQYSGGGPIMYYYNICPILKGVGYTQVFQSVLSIISYNVLIAWSLYYLIQSFQANLPWASCNNSYNSKDCIVHYINHSEYSEEILKNNYSINYSAHEEVNSTDDFYSKVSSSEEFFTLKMLNKSSGLEDIGDMQWKVLGCCFLVWFVLLIVMIGGISKTTKIIYFTATFPYIMLMALFIRGVTLKGSFSGIYYFIVPDWNKLFIYNVWAEAATQVAYSASLGASISTLASFNKFHHNFARDGIVIMIANSLTSLFCGLTVFAILGFMSFRLGVGIESVIKSDIGLAYIAIPDAVSLMPLPQLWSAFFFITLFLLGIDSSIAQMEVIITGIVDIKPELKSQKRLLVIIMCLMGTLTSLPFSTGAGMYFVELLTDYLPLWSTLMLLFFEGFIIIFFYGIRNLLMHIDGMLMTRYSASIPKIWLVTLIVCIAFTIETVLLFTSFVYFVTPKSGGYVYPFWARILGFIISFVPFLPIPLLAVHQLCKSGYCRIGFKEASIRLIRPTKLWANIGKLRL